MSFYLIKTPPAGSITQQIQYSKDYAALLDKYSLKIVGIQYSSLKVTELDDKIDADVILHSQNDLAAGKRVVAYLKDFNGMFYHNAVFVEDKINLVNDPDTANLLGLVQQKSKANKNKAAIKGKNTSNKGEIQIDILRVVMEGPKPKFAHHYDIYGALVTDEGAGIDSMVGQLFKSKGLVKGLNSGDKYSIYAIPVDIDGNEGKPTPSFVIRIN